MNMYAQEEGRGREIKKNSELEIFHATAGQRREGSFLRPKIAPSSITARWRNYASVYVEAHDWFIALSFAENSAWDESLKEGEEETHAKKQSIDHYKMNLTSRL